VIVSMLQLVVVVLGAATFIMLTLAILGHRDPAQPRCRACRGLLVPQRLLAGEPCERCGATLTEPRDILPRWRPASRSTFVLFAATVALLVGSIFALREAARAMAPVMAPGGPFAGPLAPLVDQAIWSPGGNAGTMHFILTRLRSGSATKADLRAAILASLANPDAPLPAPNRQVLARLGAAVMDASSSDAAWQQALLEALEPAPRLRATTRGADEVVIHFEPLGAQNWDDPSPMGSESTCWSTQIVRAVRVDGRPVAFRPAHGAPAIEFALSRSGAAIAIDSLPPGRHEIEVELEAVLLEAFDGRRIARVDYRRQDGVSWPTPLRSAPRTARLVIGGDASLEEGSPADPEGDPDDGTGHEPGSRSAP